MFHRHDRKWTVRPLLVAALIASILVLPASQRPDATVKTAAAEWRHLTLEDGTVVTVGPRTVFTYSYSRNRRSIHLISGEALFQVEKDPQRPFVVDTPVGCARAVGTKFSVSHQLRSTAIVTEEGIVAAAHLDPDDPDCATRNSIRLFPGQKTVIQSWTPLVARSVDTAIEHAWANREVIFTGQTVEEALSAFNRRNWVQLDVPRDADILQIKMFGHHRLDDPERFARYLEKELRWRQRNQ